MQNNYLTIESNIKYIFRDRKLMITALTHPSYANENNISKCCTNQRLEFLGDAVLELICSDYLYKLFPNFCEGELTKIRARLVCEESLANIARELKLYEFLRLGNGEDIKKVINNNSIMCDTIEALIGAIYLDNGIFDAYNFVNNFILTEENINKADNDFKSILQEYTTSRNIDLKYVLISESGPDHEKVFEIGVLINNKLIGKGIGKSKKEAEQKAAEVALKQIPCNCK